MQKYTFEVIGTHLFLSLDTSEDMTDLFRDIKTRLQDFEAKFSRFLEWNWLDDLNTSRRSFFDSDAKKMLSMMLDVAWKTDGYFDPTIGKRLTELWYGNSTLGMKNTITNTWSGNYRDIEIIWDEVILHGDILLEFGWVGKGYFIDILREMIAATWIGDKRYLINFWWDMYGMWAWKVGLESPFVSDEAIGTIVLDSFSFACSAGTRRKWWAHHHLIDPYTGESAREVVASYIESDRASIADMYATALCVMPWTLAITLLEKTPEISGVIVRHDGIVFQKKGSRAEIFT